MVETREASLSIFLFFDEELTPGKRVQLRNDIDKFLAM